jgi:hypothetical protein
MSQPPGAVNETGADIKQFGWGLALVYPFIIVTAYAARDLLGAQLAAWFGIGLAVLATTAFALVLAFSIVASYASDTAGWFNRRRKADEPAQSERPTGARE